MKLLPRHKLGIALMLCLPVLGIAAGLYCHFAPREYYAQTTIEFSYPNTGDLFKAFAAAAMPFPESAKFQNVRNTSLYDIGVYDLKPQEAADRANAIAAMLQQKMGPDYHFHATGSESNPRTAMIEKAMRRRPAVKIWVAATPPAAPSRPDVFMVMILGLAPGLMLAVIGGVLLIVVSSRSAPETA